jgi:hypothetical protein
LTEIRFSYGDIGILHADSQRTVRYLGALGRHTMTAKFIEGILTTRLTKKQRRNFRAWLRRNPDLRRRFEIDKHQQVDGEGGGVPAVLQAVRNGGDSPVPDRPDQGRDGIPLLPF